MVNNRNLFKTTLKMKRWFIEKTERLIQNHKYDGSDTLAIYLNLYGSPCSLLVFLLDLLLSRKYALTPGGVIHIPEPPLRRPGEDHYGCGTAWITQQVSVSKQVGGSTN